MNVQILAFALVFLALPSHAMYKCLSPDGKTTFQQTACPNSDQSARVRTTVGPSPADGRPENIRRAVAERKIVLGMTRAELNRVMRVPPDKDNSSLYSSGRHDQLIYYQTGRTLYVYTENDVVTAVQDNEGPPPRPSAAALERPTRPSKVCPSDAEIRSLEIDQSMIRNRNNDALQAELARQLSEARACRRDR